MVIERRPMAALRELTSARVAQRMTGGSLATVEVLAFQQAHALARDAVHAEFDTVAFAERLRVEVSGIAVTGTLELRSNARDRAAYLRGPHLGRTLAAESAARLRPGGYDLAIVVADGLSATAVERNAIPVLQRLMPMLAAVEWSMAPVAVVRQGRVAVGDPIGNLQGARCLLMLIGERPGLSCPDSLGAYITWAPHPACSDADRVCLSNMHDAGLRADEAAERLMEMLRAAKSQKRTGTALPMPAKRPVLPDELSCRRPHDPEANQPERA